MVRAHFIAGEEGWEEVAYYALSWATEPAEAVPGHGYHRVRRDDDALPDVLGRFD